MSTPEVSPNYRRIWGALFLGWLVSYADRAITGPVVTWMIDHKVPLLTASQNPYAFGGLIGSLFFAGYTFTQYPGGQFGDRYGHRSMILISIFWAGITTVLTGLTGGIFMFVAMRVLTGLGEGTFYSNDRTIIVRVTPPEKLGMGLGVVFTGVTFGLTIALVATPPILRWAQPILGLDAWRMPFLLMGVPTLFVAWYMTHALPHDPDRKEDMRGAVVGLLRYSGLFLVLIMSIYWLNDRLKTTPSQVAIFLTALVVIYVAVIYYSKARVVRELLFSRDLVFLYLSFIPILWHLWLYSFWSVDIIKASGGTFMAAALTASFNALAGLIGYPLGGYLSDRAAKSPGGRRMTLFWLTGAEVLCVVGFTLLLATGTHNLVLLAGGLFVSGLFFFALQPVSHALAAELAPADHRATTFGLLNLVCEIGALLAPVLSGVLRDRTGGWTAALMLDAVLLTASCACVLAIRSQRVSP